MKIQTEVQDKLLDMLKNVAASICYNFKEEGSNFDDPITKLELESKIKLIFTDEDEGKWEKLYVGRVREVP